MEHISFEGVDLAELLPRIPDSIKDGLPFGLVKLDLTGKVLEYNMAEGDLTGVSPAWAIGKNFFDEVAVCTKTANFYGRFVEGVKKGFINAVFDYTFDHREEATKVKVHMVTVPDHLGRKNVMILVKRSSKPLVINAMTADPVIPAGYIENYSAATQLAGSERGFTPPCGYNPANTSAGGCCRAIHTRHRSCCIGRDEPRHSRNQQQRGSAKHCQRRAKSVGSTNARSGTSGSPCSPCSHQYAGW